MKVTLIKAPWWVRYCPPYILGYFAALLRREGHCVEVLDLNNIIYNSIDPEYRKYWDDRDYYSLWENPSFCWDILGNPRIKPVLDKIVNGGSGVVCFTTHTTNIPISLVLAGLIKENDRKRVTVFMGHKCSRAQMAYDLAADERVDYVCPGEADISLPRLLAKLNGRAERDNLPEAGGFLMKKSGRIIDRGDPEAAGDLDALPFPDYSDFAEDIKGRTYSQPRRLDILDSRGCVNACHFCYERLYWQRYRSMSGKRIFEQITAHMNAYAGIDFFYFNGLLLNGDLSVLEQFCDLVTGNDVRVRWEGQAAVRKDMKPGLLRKMKRAGCEALYFGIESGSQKVLESMNKNFRIKDAVRVLKDAHKAGIRIQINMMFGFPGETRREFEESLAFLVKVRPYIDSILASQSFCTLEKNTYLRKNPEKYGITDSRHHLYWEAAGGGNNYEERFARYEEFCALALSLGIPETSGILRKKPDKWLLLGDYHVYKEEYEKAAECYAQSVAEETANRAVYVKLARAYAVARDYGRAEKAYSEALKFEAGRFAADLSDEKICSELERMRSSP
ncbi:MAG: radical SAM protein [Elusimicrobia bacterium]|nr:radical SAM protein [Elusimicrobiota bacterium]